MSKLLLRMLQKADFDKKVLKAADSIGVMEP